MILRASEQGKAEEIQSTKDINKDISAVFNFLSLPVKLATVVDQNVQHEEEINQNIEQLFDHCKTKYKNMLALYQLKSKILSECIKDKVIINQKYIIELIILMENLNNSLIAHLESRYLTIISTRENYTNNSTKTSKNTNRVAVKEKASKMVNPTMLQPKAFESTTAIPKTNCTKGCCTKDCECCKRMSQLLSRDNETPEKVKEYYLLTLEIEVLLIEVLQYEIYAYGADPSAKTDLISNESDNEELILKSSTINTILENIKALHLYLLQIAEVQPGELETK